MKKIDIGMNFMLLKIKAAISYWSDQPLPSPNQDRHPSPGLSNALHLGQRAAGANLRRHVFLALSSCAPHGNSSRASQPPHDPIKRPQDRPQDGFLDSTKFSSIFSFSWYNDQDHPGVHRSALRHRARRLRVPRVE